MEAGKAEAEVRVGVEQALTQKLNAVAKGQVAGDSLAARRFLNALAARKRA